MTTNQALQQLLFDDATWLLPWLRSGRTKQDRYYLRHRFNCGKMREETKENLLQQVGFSVQTVKQWTPQKK